MIRLSIVVPVFNEQKNIKEFYKRLKPVVKKITNQHEIIFIDDGSYDTSLDLLKKLRERDSRVKIILFARNFGHMPAVDAGLANANGDLVAVMDADLQDPPEVIPKMIEKVKEGYDVVYGIKRKRKEGIIRRLLFSYFYWFLNKLSFYKMPLDAGTFSIMSSRVVKILVSLPEKNKYLSGLRAWAGFSQTGIVYERGRRFSGKPASLTRLIKLALDGIISFSYVPLRLASFLGFVFASLAFLGIVGVFTLRFFFGFGIVGWASTMSTILLVGGIQLITLGIIGEYLARIYEEVKNRPPYIITEKIGFSRGN